MAEETATPVPGSPTPEERAAAVVSNCTGPINVRRYACNALEGEVAAAIRAAVAEEREACAKVARDELTGDPKLSALQHRIAGAIRARGT